MEQLKKSEQMEIIQFQVPKEIDEIIRQYGDIIETYKHIVEIWSRPPTLLFKEDKK